MLLFIIFATCSIFRAVLNSRYEHRDNALQITVKLIAYADDMCILSDTVSHLHTKLHKIKHFCDLWGLQVNVKKQGNGFLKKGLYIG